MHCGNNYWSPLGLLFKINMVQVKVMSQIERGSILDMQSRIALYVGQSDLKVLNYSIIIAKQQRCPQIYIILGSDHSSYKEMT